MISVSCNNYKTEQKIQPQDTTSAIEKKPGPVTEIQTDKAVDTRIFQNEDQSWGYDIYLKGKLYIHQPHVPVISGTHGFQSEDDARKTAEFVSNKIEKNSSLPSVSKAELDSLDVIPK